MTEGMTYPHPAVEKLVINTPSTGMDPMTALLAGRNNDGLFGSGGGGILPLLVGAFLFGGNRGLWGTGGAGGVGGDALAAQSIFTPKDTSAQLNTFQSWAQTNAAALAQQLGTTQAQVIQTVSGVSDRLFAAFVAQAQAQTAQLNDLSRSNTDQINSQTQTLLNGFNQLRDANGAILGQMAAGFAAEALAECQTQNLINSTKADSDFKNASQFCALAKQLAECCCENRLAISNQNALIERNTAALSSQMSTQTCEIKQAISADGQATRALIQQINTDNIQAQLADAKNALRDQQIIAACAHRHHHCGGNGNGNGNDK